VLKAEISSWHINVLQWNYHNNKKTELKYKKVQFLRKIDTFNKNSRKFITYFSFGNRNHKNIFKHLHISNLLVMDKDNNLMQEKFVIDKEDVNELLRSFMKKYVVFAPVEKKHGVSFQKIDDEKNLCLSYTSTTTPPKKVLYPYKEKLFSFDLSKSEFFESKDNKKTIIFGIHPCDVNAILQLDEFFSNSMEDVYYTARRENLIIFAINCNHAGENCFCSSLGTGPFLEKGYDLLLTDIGEKYLLEVGSDKGKDLIQGNEFREATDDEIEKKREVEEKALREFKKFVDFDSLKNILKEKYTDEIWEEVAEEGTDNSFPCLSCASCSLVCPTCYCYEVFDYIDISLEKGSRFRELDSCQLLEYAEVAGGNFRQGRKERLRHWMMCKFGFAAAGESSKCVGCGRCIEACPAGIDITEVARRLGERNG